MTETVFNLDKYHYPALITDVREKIKRLQSSINRLEDNLITPESMQMDCATEKEATDTKTGAETTQATQQSNLLKHSQPKHSQPKHSQLKHSHVNYSGELNPSQLLAATTIHGKVLVIAGAGSGKTKTLTYRSSYLIEQGVTADSILLLTFTRKAADEIKNRVKDLLADDTHPEIESHSTGHNDTKSNDTESNDTESQLVSTKNLDAITSGTFHSFCTQLLRRYAGLLGINPRFTILDTGDSEDAIDLICKEKGYKQKSVKQAFPRKSTLQKLISTSRNRRIALTELIAEEYPDLIIFAELIECLAKDYHRYKRQNHLYDFDDIISQVVSHLKNNLTFRHILQNKYQHVMVDEYQDTNIPQKQLIDYICATDEGSLMVVGDDNQSIYAFRGANYENILLFGDTYPDAKLIKLEQNYRSTPAILNYVNALSTQITLGYQKQLFSELTLAGNKPVLCRRVTEAAEAQYIADKIVELTSEFCFSDFAILSRTSFQSNHLQLEFMKRSIPFIVVGGIKFIEKRHIKDILALVKIGFNPNDTIAWHRILTLFKGVGEVTASRVTQAISLHNGELQPLLDPKLSRGKEQLHELYHVLTQAAKQETVAEILEIFIDFYLPILKTVEENWLERSEDFHVLQDLAKEHTSVERFLENLALDPPNDSATVGTAADQPQNVVTISTIHSAKGLEWPVVFIISLIDGLMPHHRSLHEFESVEEERKLFYVACSRAKTHLYLTAPHHYSSYAGYFDKLSRFVSEVDKDCVEIEEETLKIINKKNGLIENKTEPEWW